MSLPRTKSWTVRIGTMGIQFRTVNPNFSRDIQERYGNFIVESAVHEPVDFQIDLTRLGRLNGGIHPIASYSINVFLKGHQLHLRSPVLEGDFDLEQRRGQLALDPHPRCGAGVYLDNALRQVAQILAVKRGNFLLHAAAVAHPGKRAVDVFSGKSGSGKTTISFLLRKSGGQVVSDDIVLIETGGAEPHVIQTPFFGSLQQAMPPSRESFPISQVSFLEKAENASIQTIGNPSLAFALVLANIPFTDCFDGAHRHELLDTITPLVEKVPVRRIRFRRDASFLPLIGWETFKIGMEILPSLTESPIP